jgi:AI-2 transport protein TqsA
MPPTPERGARGWPLVIAAAMVVLIAGLRAAQTILIPVLIAAFLAVLSAPLVLWLRRRRVPAVVAALIVVVALLGVLSGLGAILSGSVNDFIGAIPRYQESLNALRENVTQWLASTPLHGLTGKLPSLVNLGAVMGLLGTGLKGLVAALSNTLLVVLTMVFMLLEAATLPDKLGAAFGTSPGDLGRFTRVTAQVQQYLLIKTATSLTTGILIWVWLTILGLDFALVWGLLAFLLNYIPNLGSIIAAVPAILLAAVQLGPSRTLAVLIGYVVVNMLIGNVIEPNLMGRRLGLSTLVVFLSMVFWGWVWGPIGMLLSVPLTMIVKILLENSEEWRWVAVILDNHVDRPPPDNAGEGRAEP